MKNTLVSRLLFLFLISSCSYKSIQTSFNENRSKEHHKLKKDFSYFDYNLAKSLKSFGIVVDTGNPYNNYIVINSVFTANKINRNNSYQIDVYGKFTSNGVTANVGPLTINSRNILANTSNLYEYHYNDSTLAEGKSLYGTTATVNVAGIDDPLSRTLSPYTIVVPKEIFPSTISLPSSMLNRNLNFPLTWQADANNQYHQVQITVTYYRGLSSYKTLNMPTSLPNLIYTVADNGAFAIPASDLVQYPKGAYVGISIARVSYVYGSNRVYYVGISEAHTIPLLVIDNNSCDPLRNISGPSTLCSSSTYSLVSNILPKSDAVWTATPSGIVTIAGTGPSVVVTKVSTGNVTLSTLVANCQDNGTTQLTKTIRVGGFNSPDYPVSGPSSACKNSNVTYSTISLTGATGYTWIYPSTWSISGQNTPSINLHTGTSTGGYTVGVRVANACDAGGSPAFTFLNLNNCGFIITVSPNPTTQSINISSAKSNLVNLENESSDIYKVQIIDETGIVQKELAYPGGAKNVSINLTSLKSGKYTIHAYNGTSWTYANFIKN